MRRKATTVHISARFQCLNRVLTRRVLLYKYNHHVFWSFIVIASCKIQSDLGLWEGATNTHNRTRTASLHPTSPQRAEVMDLQGREKKFANLAQLQPGRARQKSLAGPGRNISQPRTNTFSRLCTFGKSTLPNTATFSSQNNCPLCRTACIMCIHIMILL